MLQVADVSSSSCPLVSCFAFYCHAKHHDQNQYGEEMVCLVYTSLSQCITEEHQRRNSSRNLEAGTEEKKMERNLLVGLLLMAFSWKKKMAYSLMENSFSYHLGPPAQGSYHPW